jgi:hypothetical protein
MHPETFEDGWRAYMDGWRGPWRKTVGFGAGMVVFGVVARVLIALMEAGWKAWVG